MRIYCGFGVDLSRLSPLYRQSVVTENCKICKKWLGIRLPSHLKTLLGYLFFSVVTDETIIRRSSMHFFWKSSNSVLEILFVSYKSSSQYSLSLHSLSAISNFEMKSFVPCAYCASWTFAPTEVPQRKSWFIKALSTPFCFNARHRKTMSLAKFFGFCSQYTVSHNELLVTTNLAKPIITCRRQS